jgi:hypothetical protein
MGAKREYSSIPSQSAVLIWRLTEQEAWVNHFSFFCFLSFCPVLKLYSVMDLRLMSAASETKAFILLMIYDKPFFYWKTLLKL